MTVALEPMTPGFGVKSCYRVLVDGQMVGSVQRKRVEHRTRYTRWTRVSGPVETSRRSRPWAWVAHGASGRRRAYEVRTTRERAVEALLAALELNGG